jgi:hypothetical protein
MTLMLHGNAIQLGFGFDPIAEFQPTDGGRKEV